MPPDTTRLEPLGWNSTWAAVFAPHHANGFEPARVAVEDKHHYVLFAAGAELPAQVSGRLRRLAACPAQLPKVGDWVACRRVPGETKAVIHDVLPRVTTLSRKVPGRPLDEHVLVTNVHLAFVVQALDETFNPRRLERCVLMIRQGGIQPVVVLNKADLVREPATMVTEATRAGGGAPVIVACALTGRGLSNVRKSIRPGETVVFVGSSGVGKSTLINRLYGEDIQATSEVRASDAKGRHTTSWRELFVLPCGGLVIDTPGMREFQLWSGGESVAESFPDIAELGAGCRFRDCQHGNEPDCAVRAAATTGALAPERYQGYLKLKNELENISRGRRLPRPGGRPRHRPMAPCDDPDEEL